MDFFLVIHQSLIDTDFCKAQRTPEEEGDYMAFEQLVAEAAVKKEKKKGREKKGDHSGVSTSTAAHAAAADAPNVPRGK